jgi:hypothetical protein
LVLLALVEELKDRRCIAAVFVSALSVDLYYV